MIANNKRGAGRRTGKRSGPRRNKGQRMSDAPPTVGADITTRSVIPPRVSEYTVIRSIAFGTIAAQATASSAPTYNFTLSSSNASAGTFDQYRIPAVRFSIKPNQNAIQLLTNSTTTVTSIVCVIDYDDSSALGSYAAGCAYANAVIVPPGKSLSRTFRPHIAVAAYQGTFGGYANMSDVWLDSAYNTIQHYGVKLFIPGVTAAQTQLQTWDIEIEYYIELKKSI